MPQNGARAVGERSLRRFPGSSAVPYPGDFYHSGEQGARSGEGGGGKGSSRQLGVQVCAVKSVWTGMERQDRQPACDIYWGHLVPGYFSKLYFFR